MAGRKLHRIGLINPRRETWSKNPKIKKVLEEKSRFLKAWYSPSLSILTIAGHTPGDIEVSYIDEDFETIDFDAGYDLVGISAMTQQATRAVEIADEFRKRGTFVAVGGIHATVRPDEMLASADAVFIGESEKTWPDFLDDFRSKRERRIYRQEEDVFIDMSGVSMPAYEVIKGKNYFKDPKLYYNMVPVQASRGCPHDCEFCLVTRINGRKYRKKPIGQIRDEIERIKEFFPNKLVMFADDNLFLDRKFSRKLLTEIGRLGIRWVAQSDISVANDEGLLELIYESGGLFLLIGFESINPENLKSLNRNSWKYKQLLNYERSIRAIQDHGIMVFGSFIFGLDGDDAGVFRHVVDFMDRNNITGQLTIATPLPGSRMLERIKDENRLLVDEPYWDRCTFFDILFEPKNMNVDELEEGFIWAYEQIFNEESFSRRARFLKEIYKRIRN